MSRPSQGKAPPPVPSGRLAPPLPSGRPRPSLAATVVSDLINIQWKPAVSLAEENDFFLRPFEGLRASSSVMNSLLPIVLADSGDCVFTGDSVRLASSENLRKFFLKKSNANTHVVSASSNAKKTALEKERAKLVALALGGSMGGRNRVMFFRQFATALITCDYAVATTELMYPILQLLKTLTAEESEAVARLIESNNSALELFEEADIFIWEMRKVPMAKARIECMIFEQSFDDLFGMAVNSLTTIYQGLEVLEKNKGNLETFFSKILAIGNSLNEGSVKLGRFSAFSLTTLSKLCEVKSSLDSRIDLLHFLLHVHNNDVIFSETDLRALKNAANLRCYRVREEVKELIDSVLAIAEIRSQVRQVDGDLFGRKMDAFSARIEPEIAWLSEFAFRVFASYRNLSVFFQDSKTTYPPPKERSAEQMDLLELFAAFSTLLRSHEKEMKKFKVFQSSEILQFVVTNIVSEETSSMPVIREEPSVRSTPEAMPVSLQKSLSDLAHPTAALIDRQALTASRPKLSPSFVPVFTVSGQDPLATDKPLPSSVPQMSAPVSNATVPLQSPSSDLAESESSGRSSVSNPVSAGRAAMDVLPAERVASTRPSRMSSPVKPITTITPIMQSSSPSIGASPSMSHGISASPSVVHLSPAMVPTTMTHAMSATITMSPATTPAASPVVRVNRISPAMTPAASPAVAPNRVSPAMTPAASPAVVPNRITPAVTPAASLTVTSNRMSPAMTPAASPALVPNRMSPAMTPAVDRMSPAMTPAASPAVAPIRMGPAMTPAVAPNRISPTMTPAVAPNKLSPAMTPAMAPNRMSHAVTPTIAMSPAIPHITMNAVLPPSIINSSGMTTGVVHLSPALTPAGSPAVTSTKFTPVTPISILPAMTAVAHVSPLTVVYPDYSVHPQNALPARVLSPPPLTRVSSGGTEIRRPFRAYVKTSNPRDILRQLREDVSAKREQVKQLSAIPLQETSTRRTLLIKPSMENLPTTSYPMRREGGVEMKDNIAGSRLSLSKTVNRVATMLLSPNNSPRRDSSGRQPN